MTPHPHPHPWSHLYFCAFLHRHVCLNADGIKRLLLPQSISVFLFYLLLLISRVCGMHWLQTNQSPVGDLHHDPCMEFIGSILRASPPMSLLTGWPCVLTCISSVYVLMSLSWVFCLFDVLLMSFLVFLHSVLWNCWTLLNWWEFHKKANETFM